MEAPLRDWVPATELRFNGRVQREKKRRTLQQGHERFGVHCGKTLQFVNERAHLWQHLLRRYRGAVVGGAASSLASGCVCLSCGHAPYSCPWPRDLSPFPCLVHVLDPGGGLGRVGCSFVRGLGLLWQGWIGDLRLRRRRSLLRSLSLSLPSLSRSLSRSRSRLRLRGI